MNYNIIINGDNPNISEILDYVRDYYVRHIDYNLEFEWTSDMGHIGEITSVTLSLLTDEIREDGNIQYLACEHTVE